MSLPSCFLKKRLINSDCLSRLVPSLSFSIWVLQNMSRRMVLDEHKYQRRCDHDIRSDEHKYRRRCDCYNLRGPMILLAHELRQLVEHLMELHTLNPVPKGQVLVLVLLLRRRCRWFLLRSRRAFLRLPASRAPTVCRALQHSLPRIFCLCACSVCVCVMQ